MSKIYNGALELVGNTPLVEVKNIEEEKEKTHEFDFKDNTPIKKSKVKFKPLFLEIFYSIITKRRISSFCSFSFSFLIGFSIQK